MEHFLKNGNVEIKFYEEFT